MGGSVRRWARPRLLRARCHLSLPRARLAVAGAPLRTRTTSPARGVPGRQRRSASPCRSISTATRCCPSPTSSSSSRSTAAASTGRAASRRGRRSCSPATALILGPSLACGTFGGQFPPEFKPILDTCLKYKYPLTVFADDVRARQRDHGSLALGTPTDDDLRRRHHAHARTPRERRDHHRRRRPGPARPRRPAVRPARACRRAEPQARHVDRRRRQRDQPHRPAHREGRPRHDSQGDVVGRQARRRAHPHRLARVGVDGHRRRQRQAHRRRDLPGDAA